MTSTAYPCDKPDHLPRPEMSITEDITCRIFQSRRVRSSTSGKRIGEVHQHLRVCWTSFVQSFEEKRELSRTRTTIYIWCFILASSSVEVWGKACPPLRISSPGIMQGFWNRPFGSAFPKDDAKKLAFVFGEKSMELIAPGMRMFPQERTVCQTLRCSRITTCSSSLCKKA